MQSTNDLAVMYTNNARFKRYVDRYAESYRMTVEEALQSALVREYAAECKRPETLDVQELKRRGLL